MIVGEHAPPFIKSDYAVAVGIDLPKELVELRVGDSEACAPTGSLQFFSRDLAIAVVVNAPEEIGQLVLRFFHEGAKFLTRTESASYVRCGGNGGGGGSG